MKIFLFVIFLMSALPSLAQTKVTGCVVDSLTRQPLKGAAVTLTRGGRAVSFGRTDEKGRFTVAVQGGDSLQVTFLGYAKKRVAAVKGREMVVEMTQKAFALKEVQVKGMPVFGRQDTTFFDLKRYASERDNTLKDVLKKLPGVDVDDRANAEHASEESGGLGNPPAADIVFQSGREDPVIDVETMAQGELMNLIDGLSFVPKVRQLIHQKAIA